MGPSYVGAHGSMAQQQQQQAQVLSMTSARSAPRPLDFPPYCSRANPALPTIHSFPSLDGKLPMALSPQQYLAFTLRCLTLSTWVNDTGSAEDPPQCCADPRPRHCLSSTPDKQV